MLYRRRLRLRTIVKLEPARALAGDGATSREALLAVILQDLVTGLGDLRTMILQAGQNGEITLVHHVAAETLHVTGAGLLLFRSSAALLGHRTGGNRYRHKTEREEKLIH